MSSQPDERLNRAADHWVQLQDREPTEEEVAQWLAWMEEEGGNTEAFKKIEALAQRLHHTRGVAPERLRPLHGRQPRWRKPAVWASAAAVTFAVGIAGLLRFGFSSDEPRIVATDKTFSTPIAQQREVMLSDGSRVTLGGASTIEDRYSADRREVRLVSGEAYFDVKPEIAGRPFFVDAGAATVRALGTAFNVRRNEARVSVTVMEGRVQVVRSSTAMQSLAVATGLREPQSVQAGPAEQVIVESQSEPLKSSSADPRRATAWREGRLEFVDEPLDVVIGNVSRYSQIGLVAADPKLHDITYTGTFVPGHFDSWLNAMKDVFGLQVRREGAVLAITR